MAYVFRCAGASSSSGSLWLGAIRWGSLQSALRIHAK